MRPPHSLRARLLWFLLAAIALSALAQGLIAYRNARAEADSLFDYHMQQMAYSLRAGVLATPDALPEDEAGFDFFVQVWTNQGLRVFQSTPRMPLPQRAQLGFADVPANGTTYRVFSLQSRAQVIQVAQDLAIRRRMAGELALRTLAPTALMAPLLMLVVWWVISSSLAPVARVRSQVAARQAEDLSELSEAQLPDEIQPLVHEINLLFRRLNQAFEAQKNFVADAAHELRSPLAALRLQVQGLQRATDPAGRELAVARLTAGIDRATRLVEQLLVLARQQASAAAGARPQAVPLADLVRQGVAEAAWQAQEFGIDLGVGHAEAGTIDGHPEALRILLRNLVDNALKHTPADGTVDVEVRPEAQGYMLTVEDSGPGIAPEDRARVLDRFYRVPGSVSNGSGLGLAIVRSIAELHGATLALDASPRLGGLRVAVHFPAAPPPAAPLA